MKKLVRFFLTIFALPTGSQSIEDISNAFTALEPYCVAANGWHEWRFIKVK